MNRREFFTAAGSAGMLAAGIPDAGAQTPAPPDDRQYWTTMLRKIADPVLNNLTRGTLKARMPVEQTAGATGRADVTHLEAFGRLMAGLAPWIALPSDSTPEGRMREDYASLAKRALKAAVDPSSPDLLNFSRSSQPLVDAAFLAQAVIRAPRVLSEEIDLATKQRLIGALISSRVITPAYSNWLLFTAMVEAGLKTLGAEWDRTRVDYALRQHDAWYKGDGVYGDGPEFHWDYYNSFVIHPMLLDVLSVVDDGTNAAWRSLAPRERARAQRYAAIQERLIAPDGTFPPIGRSIAYRCGAFHMLAHAALHQTLPEGVRPEQVRGALTSVLHKSLDAPETFDAGGWLRIGFCGHQPGVGETYISTGSLYLCAVAFLPLGLPASDVFWSGAPQPWTSVKAWSGQPFSIDHALA